MRYQDACKEDLRKRLRHRYQPDAEGDILDYEEEEIVELIFRETAHATDDQRIAAAQMLANGSGYITPTRRRK